MCQHFRQPLYIYLFCFLPFRYTFYWPAFTFFCWPEAKVTRKKERESEKKNKPHFCPHFYSIENEIILRLFYKFALNCMPLPFLKKEKGWLLITALTLATYLNFHMSEYFLNSKPLISWINQSCAIIMITSKLVWKYRFSSWRNKYCFDIMLQIKTWSKGRLSGWDTSHNTY